MLHLQTMISKAKDIIARSREIADTAIGRYTGQYNDARDVNRKNRENLEAILYEEADKNGVEDTYDDIELFILRNDYINEMIEGAYIAEKLYSRSINEKHAGFNKAEWEHILNTEIQSDLIQMTRPWKIYFIHTLLTTTNPDYTEDLLVSKDEIERKMGETDSEERREKKNKALNELKAKSIVERRTRRILAEREEEEQEESENLKEGSKEIYKEGWRDRVVSPRSEFLKRFQEEASREKEREKRQEKASDESDAIARTDWKKTDPNHPDNIYLKIGGKKKSNKRKTRHTKRKHKRHHRTHRKKKRHSK